MNNLKSNKEVDILLIYQERDVVQHSINQIQDLKLNLSTLVFEQSHIKEIVDSQAKIILLSSNNVANTIKFYIELLESNGQEIAQHKVILLVNIKEATKAYLACENGLVDNYVVINPLNDANRLNLVLLQSLKVMLGTDHESLQTLVKLGEEELAACISHGATLKQYFQSQLKECESQLQEAVLPSKEAVNPSLDPLQLETTINAKFEELNKNIETKVQEVFHKLLNVKKLQDQLSHYIADEVMNSCKTEILKQQNIAPVSEPLNANQQTPKKEKLYKILIAEHDQESIAQLFDVFESENVDIKVTNTGKDTLIKLKEFSPHVLLISYDLEDHNGFEVTKKLRANNDKTPIVAFSHHHDKKLISQWVALGLDGYLVKPAKNEAIYEAVKKAIKDPTVVLKMSNDGSTDLKWVPEYSIGNEEIDEQHKVLFSLINDFFNDTSKESVIHIFSEIFSYMQLHFGAEEQLLKEIAYPNIVHHKKKHRALDEKLKEIQLRLNNYTIDEHHKIAMFLYNWLSKHILKEDMDYKQYAISSKQPSFFNDKGADI